MSKRVYYRFIYIYTCILTMWLTLSFITGPRQGNEKRGATKTKAIALWIRVLEDTVCMSFYNPSYEEKKLISKTFKVWLTEVFALIKHNILKVIKKYLVRKVVNIPILTNNTRVYLKIFLLIIVGLHKKMKIIFLIINHKT